MITYSEIAKFTGVSTAYISMLASGKRKPSWTLSKRISSLMGVTPEQIIENPMLLKKFKESEYVARIHADKFS